jgi:hypothetical protein
MPVRGAKSVAHLGLASMTLEVFNPEFPDPETFVEKAASSDWKEKLHVNKPDKKTSVIRHRRSSARIKSKEMRRESLLRRSIEQLDITNSTSAIDDASSERGFIVGYEDLKDSNEEDETSRNNESALRRQRSRRGSGHSALKRSGSARFSASSSRNSRRMTRSLDGDTDAVRSACNAYQIQF